MVVELMGQVKGCCPRPVCVGEFAAHVVQLTDTVVHYGFALSVEDRATRFGGFLEGVERGIRSTGR